VWAIRHGYSTLIIVNGVEWMTTAQAARRLGVRPQTLYAYVSRGQLQSRRVPNGRQSRFDAHEVERLALRGRPRLASRSPSLDIQIETSITEIADHCIRYRGHEVSELARNATFEMAAELIWTGTLPGDAPTWNGPTVVSGGVTCGEQLRLITARAAIGDSGGLDRLTVTTQARRLIATIANSLPIAGTGRCPRVVLADGTAVRGTIAGRLWARLTTRRPTPSLMAAMNAGLVLLADHEMAASTLAARIAASTRADVHGVVAAGMGTLSGALHGGESTRCRRFLELAQDRPIDEAIDLTLERYGRLPGFGQVLYPKGDPRADLLLTLLHDGGPHPALDHVDRVIDAARRFQLPPPNVDLALAVFGNVATMPRDAGEAIFTTARIVGWVAHALEEYDERPLRFRPRAVYVGPTGDG
jgi:citrate synthase